MAANMRPSTCLAHVQPARTSAGYPQSDGDLKPFELNGLFTNMAGKATDRAKQGPPTGSSHSRRQTSNSIDSRGRKRSSTNHCRQPTGLRIQPGFWRNQRNNGCLQWTLSAGDSVPRCDQPQIDAIRGDRARPIDSPTAAKRLRDWFMKIARMRGPDFEPLPSHRSPSQVKD